MLRLELQSTQKKVTSLEMHLKIQQSAIEDLTKSNIELQTTKNQLQEELNDVVVSTSALVPLSHVETRDQAPRDQIINEKYSTDAKEEFVSISLESSDKYVPKENKNQISTINSAESIRVSSSASPSEEVEGLYYVTQLKRSIADTQKHISDLQIELESARHQLQEEKNAKVKSMESLESLKAFYERTNKLINSDNKESMLNFEYLKQCVFKLMISGDPTEKARIYPVLALILKFTPAETRRITEEVDVLMNSNKQIVDTGWLGGIVNSTASSISGMIFNG